MDVEKGRRRDRENGEEKNEGKKEKQIISNFLIAYSGACFVMFRTK
jgi:hypothetical protein